MCIKYDKNRKKKLIVCVYITYILSVIVRDMSVYVKCIY
jgi:hypothetical protein